MASYSGVGLEAKEVILNKNSFILPFLFQDVYISKLELKYEEIELSFVDGILELSEQIIIRNNLSSLSGNEYKINRNNSALYNIIFCTRRAPKAIGVYQN